MTLSEKELDSIRAAALAEEKQAWRCRAAPQMLAGLISHIGYPCSVSDSAKDAVRLADALWEALNE